MSVGVDHSCVLHSVYVCVAVKSAGCLVLGMRRVVQLPGRLCWPSVQDMLCGMSAAVCSYHSSGPAAVAL